MDASDDDEDFTSREGKETVLQWSDNEKQDVETYTTQQQNSSNEEESIEIRDERYQNKKVRRKRKLLKAKVPIYICNVGMFLM